MNGKIKTYSVPIPEGIRDGEKIRLVGQGKQGKNGGKNGDLYIKININNKGKLKLKGNDLHTDLLLSPWEAALGVRTTLNLFGEQTTIYVPKGIQTGEKISIPGKGYRNGQNGRGNLIAEVKIVIPKNLTKEEKAIFEKLNNISTFNPRKG